ncbi:putative heme iron utilization protein [Leptolyngbya sp. PCC 7375]|nr:putative heme iron utilization protein [Leptolyngbya sp. PCC 7375]
MAEAITSTISDRICKHMNDDHADAVLIYAQKFGDATAATAATMTAIDTTGMDLDATVNGQNTPVRVSFERPLADAKDAHHVLVEMLKKVKQD